MADLLETVMTIQPTGRMKRLREYYVENSKRTDPEYRIEYDLAIARSMMATEGEPMVLRRGKAFAAAVEAMPAEIFPDEPFFGWFAGTPTAVCIGAEQLGARLEIERTPIVIQCGSCGTSYETETGRADALICPDCGERGGTLLSGREYHIKEMEVQ